MPSKTIYDRTGKAIDARTLKMREMTATQLTLYTRDLKDSTPGLDGQPKVTREPAYVPAYVRVWVEYAPPELNCYPPDYFEVMAMLPNGDPNLGMLQICKMLNPHIKATESPYKGYPKIALEGGQDGIPVACLVIELDQMRDVWKSLRGKDNVYWVGQDAEPVLFFTTDRTRRISRDTMKFNS